MKFTIRPATVEDCDFIIGLVPHFVEFTSPPGREPAQVIDAIAGEICEAWEANSEDAFFIAENIDGKRLGFIYLQTITDFFTQERHGHIADIAVTPENDGQGIGQAFMQLAKDWAKERGYRILTLNAFAGNIRARSFYTRLGYESL